MKAVLGALVGLAMAVGALALQPRESSSCQSDIVSSTAIATFCGHREGDRQILDFYILWRATAGWFQNRWPGGGGTSGSGRFGGGTKGVVSQSQTYGALTVAFHADFDTSVATIGPLTIDLNRVNTVVMDNVEGEWRASAMRRIEPQLPLGRDWNLAVAQQLPDMRRALQCGVPMPPATSQMLLMTVCDKLKSR